MRRVLPTGLKSLGMLAIAALLLTPTVASAQQSVNLFIGGFVPAPISSRDFNDVLLQDESFLDFSLHGLSGPIVGGEYLVGLGDKFDAGLGVGFYQKSTLASDAFSEFQGTGNPILATLKLRVVPVTATVRWLPLGHHDGIVPYLGGGVGIFSYRYTESGDFVASDGVSIVNGNFSGSGSATGPVVLGGVRVPVGTFDVGGEIRYQHAVGNLPSDQGFATASPNATPKIDLSGMTYLFTINVKF